VHTLRTSLVHWGLGTILPRSYIPHAVVVRWLEQTVPFLVLLLIVFFSHHFVGVLTFAWLSMILQRCNIVIKQQMALWEAHVKERLLYTMATLTSSTLFVYFAFSESQLWHRLCFFTPKADTELSIWAVLWAVSMNDGLMRSIVMFIKCCLVMLFASRPMRSSRRRQMFVLAESVLSVYRTLAPVPVWYYYFVSVMGQGSFMSSLCGGLYMALKLASITERCKFLMFVVTAFHRGEATYGKYATPEELQAQQDDCSICQGPLQGPIVLSCGHLFCEECVSEWLDKEPTCPLCRAQVTPGRFHGGGGDGSTSLLPQLF